MYRETSREAYNEVKPNLNAKQIVVLEAIKIICRTAPNNRCNDKHIAKYLGWDINCVTPRRGELLAAGEITDDGKFRDANGLRSSHYWKPKKAVEKAEQQDLFAA